MLRKLWKTKNVLEYLFNFSCILKTFESIFLKNTKILLQQEFVISSVLFKFLHYFFFFFRNTVIFIEITFNQFCKDFFQAVLQSETNLCSMCHSEMYIGQLNFEVSNVIPYLDTTMKPIGQVRNKVKKCIDIMRASFDVGISWMTKFCSISSAVGTINRYSRILVTKNV